jgi:hypothetical protein
VNNGFSLIDVYEKYRKTFEINDVIIYRHSLSGENILGFGLGRCDGAWPKKYLKPEMENYRMESESKLLAGSVDPLFPEGAKKNDFFTEGTEEENEN